MPISSEHGQVLAWTAEQYESGKHFGDEVEIVRLMGNDGIETDELTVVDALERGCHERLRLQKGDLHLYLRKWVRGYRWLTTKGG